jgi:hypothetical protein
MMLPPPKQAVVVLEPAASFDAGDAPVDFDGDSVHSGDRSDAEAKGGEKRKREESSPN